MTADNTNNAKIKIIIGKVVSKLMKDTLVVEIVNYFRHPLYHKSVKRTKRYFVHAVKMQDIEPGDRVTIKSCRPVSKNKHYSLIGKVN